MSRTCNPDNQNRLELDRLLVDDPCVATWELQTVAKTRRRPPQPRPRVTWHRAPRATAGPSCDPPDVHTEILIAPPARDSDQGR